MQSRQMVNFGTTATCEGEFASGSKGREEKRGIKRVDEVNFDTTEISM